MDKKIKQFLSVPNYLRHRKNLTIAELSQEIGIPAMSISRIENGNWAIDINPVLKMANYFSVSVDAILHNDFSAVFSTLQVPTSPAHKMYDRYAKIHDVCRHNGISGEDWVYWQECKRLAHTNIRHAVNGNYADDDDAHFDMLSFSETGQPIIIEVKSTNKGPYTGFRMTAAELQTAEDCLKDNIRYEIHRVFHVQDACKIDRYVITAEELFRDYDITPKQFLVKRKAGVSS